MSSPPGTPTDRPASSHRRHPSSLDMTHSTGSRRQSFNRRSSGYSPITPRSSHEFDHDPAHQLDGGGDGNGLGNLADELGEVWDDDEEALDGEYGDELDASQDDLAHIGTAVEHDGSYGVDSAASLNGVRDSGVAMQDSSPAGLSPESAVKTRKHTRARSLYDGSDYGDDSDLENEGISPALESRMAAIESLVRRGIEENGSASDEVVKRVTLQLQNLGSQIAIENGATRYVCCRRLPPPSLTKAQTEDCPRCLSNALDPPVPQSNLAFGLLLWPTRHPARPGHDRRTSPTNPIHPGVASLPIYRATRRHIPPHTLQPRAPAASGKRQRHPAHVAANHGDCYEETESEHRAAPRLEARIRQDQRRPRLH